MILDKVALLWSDPGTASVCALYAGVVGIGLAKDLKERRRDGRPMRLVDTGNDAAREDHGDDSFGSGIDRAG